MPKILLELVPRDKEQLQTESSLVKNYYPEIHGINIPDLLKFDIRSWEAAALVRPNMPTVIPHLRAIDFDLSKDLPIIEFLKKNLIKEVLVIKGDPPQDMSRRVYQTSSIKLIRRLKTELPDIKIYASIDQYSVGIKDVLDYVELKMEAGADGFLTQPFFDLRLIDIFGERMKDTQFFFGVSPVTSEKSKNYWETRNRAYFPKDFNLSLDWNISFCKNVIQYSKENNHNLYLMPIKINLNDYLNQLFR